MGGEHVTRPANVGRTRPKELARAWSVWAASAARRTSHRSCECLPQFFMGILACRDGRRPPLGNTGDRRVILQRTMGSDQLVVLLPAGERLAHILEGDISTFRHSPRRRPMRTLDEAIFDWFPWPNTVQPNAMAVGPGVHDPTGAFAAIVRVIA